MAETTERMRQLEELLADFPDDAEIRYGLAMEHIGQGDEEAGLARLGELMRAVPPHVPAFLQAGQALVRLGREDEAKETFRQGIAEATKQGNDHAGGEMAGFLESLE